MPGKDHAVHRLEQSHPGLLLGSGKCFNRASTGSCANATIAPTRESRRNVNAHDRSIRSVEASIATSPWTHARVRLESEFLQVQTVELNATPHAVDFYRTAGFVPICTAFVRDGARVPCRLPLESFGPNCRRQGNRSPAEVVAHAGRKILRRWRRVIDATEKAIDSFPMSLHGRGLRRARSRNERGTAHAFWLYGVRAY